MRQVIAATILAVAPIWAHGGNAGGNISYVHFMGNGVVLFSLNGFRNDTPACATITTRFAFNATTPVGKVQAAGLLTAYAQGKAITVFGTGACADWGDTESVSFFYVP
jgi:hypothetical protein